MIAKGVGLGTVARIRRRRAHFDYLNSLPKVGLGWGWGGERRESAGLQERLQPVATSTKYNKPPMKVGWDVILATIWLEAPCRVANVRKCMKKAIMLFWL